MKKYYVDGYVNKINTKEEKKRVKKKLSGYTPFFKTFEQAENYRMAGIMCG